MIAPFSSPPLGTSPEAAKPRVEVAKHLGTGHWPGPVDAEEDRRGPRQVFASGCDPPEVVDRENRGELAEHLLLKEAVVSPAFP